MRSTPRKLLAVGATAALLAVPSAALAAERPAHAGQGSSTAATEDDDTNDGGTRNNVVDDGDNAHPSGKDRSVENGRSANQGKAQSDPDDDSRGPERTNRGVDQADGPGGDDKADQDGNNGCGNDDDFEDDNEGHCRRAEDDRPARSTSAQPSAGSKTEASGSQAKPAKTPPAKPATGSSQAAKPASTENESGTAGTTQTSVTGACPATSVSVSSTRDISNVVLVFADGDHQRFEGLSGRSGTFAGTGSDAGETIVRVYVKSGANASGDGPGYGARHDLGGCASGAATSTTTTTTTENGPVGGDRAGERPAPGSPAPDASAGPAAPGGSGVAGDASAPGAPAGPSDGVPGEAGVLGSVVERPSGPTTALPVAAGEVNAAGFGVQAAGTPATAPAAGPLPRTGSETLPAALAALLALLAGATAVRRTRAN